jgi:predicted small integral membrane protein
MLETLVAAVAALMVGLGVYFYYAPGSDPRSGQDGFSNASGRANRLA